MAVATMTSAGTRWTAMDRVPFLLLFAGFVVSTPGFGPETRQFSDDVIPIILLLVVLAPSVTALALSWKAPLLAARIGLAGGILVMAMIALDLLGVLIGPPPTGMVVVDGLIVLAGALIAWRCWRLVRA